MKEALIRQGALVLLALGVAANGRVGAGEGEGAPTEMIQLPGQVKADEEAELGARVPGYIQKVQVDVGDQVRKGQVLAELSVPELEADLKGKEAVAAQAEAEVERARLGCQVAEAGLLAARARVAEAGAGLKRAQAAFRRWQAESERLKQLANKQVIDRQALEEASRQLQAAQAALAEAEARVKAAEAAEAESAARREQAQAEAKVVQARLLVARAGVQQAEVLLQYAQVRAPFDGVVTWRGAMTGSLAGLAPGTKPETLFRVARIDRVRIVVQVPEADAPRVSKGARAIVRVAALSGREYRGLLTRTAAALDPARRSLSAEIDLENARGELLPGMSVTVTIAVEAREGKDERPKPKGGEGPEFHALRKAFVDLARKGFEDALKASHQTRRTEALILPLARSEDMYTWSVRWLNAQRDLSPRKDDKVAALEAHLKRMKDWQQRVTQMHQTGLVTSLDVAAAQFYQAEAELWLAQANGR
jgi:multidrug resistance efflux pump